MGSARSFSQLRSEAAGIDGPETKILIGREWQLVLGQMGEFQTDPPPEHVMIKSISDAVSQVKSVCRATLLA